MGVDLVGERAAVDAVRAIARGRRLATAGTAAFEALRIERGVPLQPFDIDDKTIPQEAFLELDAVSFTKGCFLGQELVCRIDTRGHVNRFLRRFSRSTGDWPPRGAEVVVGDKVVGRAHERRPGRAARPARSATCGARWSRPPTVELRWDGRHRPRNSTRSADHLNALDRADVAGSVTTKRVPPPSSGSTRASPPIATASSRTMASPMPVPTVRPGTVRDV